MFPTTLDCVEKSLKYFVKHYKEYNITDTGIDLTWNPNTNTNSKIHGSIEYYNNQATVSGDFEIVVPVSVTYKWGTIYTNVTLVIAKSVHQLPKK